MRITKKIPEITRLGAYCPLVHRRYRYRFPFVLNKLYDNNNQYTECGCYQKRRPVADPFIQTDTHSRGRRHRQCVHSAVNSHSGTNLFFREQRGHPGGNSDRAKGKTYSIYNSGCHNKKRRLCDCVSHTGRCH